MSVAEDKIIEKAIKRLKRATKADDHNRIAAIDDLRFLNGDQWDDREKKRRSDKGRPALTLNFLPKFVDQVVGDMLHNTPTIKITPVDSQGDINIAKIRQGIISSIEYLSNSKGIYGYAAKQMVSCGYGAWRILTRYAEENPFIQEIYLEGIRNPFLVYMDPTAKDQNYADAKWGMILEKVPRDEFEERYPKAELPFEALKFGRGINDENWFDDDTVTVAEYFVKESEKVTMHQLEDGRVVTADEYKELKKQWEGKQEDFMGMLSKGAPEAPPSPGGGMLPPGGQPAGLAPVPPQATPPGPPMNGPQPPQMGQQPPMPQGAPQGPKPPAHPQQPPNPLATQSKQLGPEPKIAKTRETEKSIIKQYIITSVEILEGGKEGNSFPGSFIPIILLKGKELNIEGKPYVYSLIRHAKDPSKLVNYWNTSAAETIALAPKAPWLGTAKQFEGYENDYAAANVENFPFLKYNPDPEAPGPPQRQQPGNPPVAIFQQIQRGEDNLKSVIGMFGSDVGENGPERTGAAITARQRPGDVATFEFIENLARAIMYTGRVINEMIPTIYDTERDVRVRNADESESFVPVNTTIEATAKSITQDPERYFGMDVARIRSLFAKNGKDAKFNDITVGKYDVAVTVGPSYSTQRQDSANQLLQLVQSLPQQMGTAADIIVRNLGFKDSEEMESRLRKPLLSAGMVKPRPGEVVTPMPPNPAMVQAQAKMQVEQGKIQLQQLKIQQENIKLEHEKVKMQLEVLKLQAEKGGKDGHEDQSEIHEKAYKLKLEMDRLELEREKFNHQVQTDYAKHNHQVDVDETKHEIEFKKIEAAKKAKGASSSSKK
jgi:hypothetical protein